MTDFGMAKKVRDIKEDLNYSICGTLSYEIHPLFSLTLPFRILSPEVFLKEGYNYLADYYSLGILTYELAVGTPPFPHKVPKKELVQAIFTRTPIFPLSLSEECKDFILKLLAKTPSNRLGAQNGIQELMEHPWLKNINFDDIEKRIVEPPIPVKCALNFKKFYWDPNADLDKDNIIENIANAWFDENYNPVSRELSNFSFDICEEVNVTDVCEFPERKSSHYLWRAEAPGKRSEFQTPRFGEKSPILKIQTSANLTAKLQNPSSSRLISQQSFNPSKASVDKTELLELEKYRSYEPEVKSNFTLLKSSTALSHFERGRHLDSKADKEAGGRRKQSLDLKMRNYIFSQNVKHLSDQKKIDK